MAKKAKRISLIAKGKSVISEMFGVKERRIRRALQAANDRAIEEAVILRENLPSLLNKLGDCDTQEKTNEVINKICDTLETIEAWETKQKYVEKIQAMLDEEVDIEEEK